MATRNDIQFTDLLRSLDMVIRSWETNNTLSSDDMLGQLEAAVDIVDGKSDLATFKAQTGLDNEVLH